MRSEAEQLITDVRKVAESFSRSRRAAVEAHIHRYAAILRALGSRPGSARWLKADLQKVEKILRSYLPGIAC